MPAASRDSRAGMGYGFGPPNAPIFGSANVASADVFGPTTQKMSPAPAPSVPIPITTPHHATPHAMMIPCPAESSRSATTQSFRRGATATKSNGTVAFLAIVGLVVGGAAFAVMGYVKPEATHRSAQATVAQITPATTSSSTPTFTTATTTTTTDEAPIGATPPVMVISAPESPVGAVEKKIVTKAASIHRATTPQKPVAKTAVVPSLPTNPYDSAASGG